MPKEQEEILSRTLTTGADGMVGSYVNFGIKTNRRSLDVTDLNEVLRVCSKYKPKVIFHLATETDVDRCEREPQYAYFVNSIGTYNIALGAKSVGAKLVYVSTAGVFDGDKEGNYTEEDKPNPKSYYGRSKYLGEVIVREILDDYIIARASWMFGGGPDKDQKFVAKIIQQLQKRDIKEILAVNDSIGSSTFARDLVAAIKKLIISNENGIFHLANKGFCTRYEIAMRVAEILNSSVKVVPVDSGYFKLAAAHLKNEKLSSRVDIMRPWYDALEEYIKDEWSDYIKK